MERDNCHNPFCIVCIGLGWMCNCHRHHARHRPADTMRRLACIPAPEFPVVGMLKRHDAAGMMPKRRARAGQAQQPKTIWNFSLPCFRCNRYLLLTARITLAWSLALILLLLLLMILLLGSAARETARRFLGRVIFALLLIVFSHVLT